MVLSECVFTVGKERQTGYCHTGWKAIKDILKEIARASGGGRKGGNPAGQPAFKSACLRNKTYVAPPLDALALCAENPSIGM